MNQSRRYKILLVGDASNYHRSLADGLRRLGHDVTVASAGSGWMNTLRDIDFSRPMKGKLGGLMLWLKFKWLSRRRLAGFDIVSINGVSFLHLKPSRLIKAFETLKKRNHHIFMSALGTDPYYVEACLSTDYLRYNEFMIGGKPSPLLQLKHNLVAEWTSPQLKNLAEKIYKESEGVITCLYEYDTACRRILPDNKVGYVGIPIDTEAIPFEPLDENISKIKFFLGRHSERKTEKGTDIFEKVISRLVANHPDKAELVIVENRPYDEYLKLLRNSHVVVDQLYSYTPATNALLAMAMGKVVISGGEPEYFDFIGECEPYPIINPIPGDEEGLYRQLEHLVLNPHLLPELGRRSRELVEKHNDTMIVATRFINFCTSKMN